MARVQWYALQYTTKHKRPEVFTFIPVLVPWSILQNLDWIRRTHWMGKR